MSDNAAPASKKRKAGGRPADEKIRKHFKQNTLALEKDEKAKRNHDAECNNFGTFIIGRPYKLAESLSVCEQCL